MGNGIIDQIGHALKKVRSNKPLIHHITNYVTVNDCANTVLAIGASPIMADDIDEVEAMTSISSALVLNIGTLNNRTVESMIAAGRKANQLNIPVVLDPVGVGASELRNQAIERILKEVNISVVRGNISEMRFIAGLDCSTKGVDASDVDMQSSLETSCDLAKSLANKLGCVVAITGATDIISDGNHTIMIKNGTELLSSVTGTGCMCTSLIGSFCGAVDDFLIAAVGGVISMGIAGELSVENTEEKGIGTFRVGIIDSISKMNAEIFTRRAKINEA